MITELMWHKLVDHGMLILSFVLVATASVTRETAANKCIDKERHALLDFKSRLQDPEGRLSSWRAEDAECCNWSGVTCNNQTRHIAKLVLYNFDTESALRGEISLSLLNLSYMNHLDLSGNLFNGTIPRFIGSLTNLRYLELDRNSFHGTIPPEFGNLTNLQELSLSYLESCTFENLDWLSHLSNLQKLTLDGNSLAKVNHWVNLILRLRKLSFLSLYDCDLSNAMHPYSSSFNSSSSSSSIVSLHLPNNNLNSSIYRWLFPLTSNRLQYLSLSDNNLDGIPEYFGNLCSLISLYFYGNPTSVKFSDFLNKLSGCTSVTLQVLRATDCQLKGSLSDDIEKFSSLKSLHLSRNQLNGTISEKLWELPNLEHVGVSSNSLRGAIFKNIGKSKLSFIDLSNNSLDGVPSEDHMSNLSSVDYIDLSSCKLGPYFPSWIRTLKNATQLNIANTRISDSIPAEFWNTWSSRLTYLNFSLNNITGEVPDLLSNFDLHSKIDLSSNKFSGRILNVSSALEILNLSNNKFSGGISFLCQIVDGFLSFLDLSDNSFTGQIPNCLWHFKELKVLNLGHNNLFGRLPMSVGSLIKLEVLYLYNNDFSGELPVSLNNCTKLTFLNLGENKFSGNVPVWIGKFLSHLYVLSLRSNNFFGPIPSQLCQLVNLQILDLSMNNLNRTIPSCVDNLTTMVQQGNISTNNVHTLLIPSYTSRGAPIVYFGSDYADHLMIQWQGNIREFTTNLGLLKSIDLSSNNLTGQIPNELTDLHGLLALNLSNNILHGEIPQIINQMKNLLMLDISRNGFSGGIPASMSQMNLLNYLDVSYNNLSGKIPSSTQLQSFEPSRYNGNDGLCGSPMTKNCLGDEEVESSPNVDETEGDEDDIHELWLWFYIGIATGFPTGFWIACGALLFNRRWRRAFFYYLESLKDWVYVHTFVLIANG